MSSKPDSGVDLELETLVCRCRAPAGLANRLHECFNARGFRVRREAGSDTRASIELSVREVQYLQFKYLSAARYTRSTPTAEMTMLYVGDRHAHSFGSVAAHEAEAVTELVRDATRPLAVATWMPVFNVSTFVRTSVDLHVCFESDADQQLAVLAPALALDRDDITIKPQPGWRGYGHPDLFRRPPGRR